MHLMHNAGKVLATGHENGAIALYNVERCEMMQHVSLHPPGVPIVNLAWVDATPSGQAHTNFRKVCVCERERERKKEKGRVCICDATDIERQALTQGASLPKCLLAEKKGGADWLWLAGAQNQAQGGADWVWLAGAQNRAIDTIAAVLLQASSFFSSLEAQTACCLHTTQVHLRRCNFRKAAPRSQPPRP
eukprot:87329-Pelagomonas_calceolata.AAC.2